MRRKNLIRGLKKKTRLPFHGKAEGGSARRRADRMATYRKPGPPGDVEPINPNEPNAPPDGAVRQKFKAGGVAKRQYGGRLPLSERSWRERPALPKPEPLERPALPNVELERPSVKELDLDLRPSVKEVGPPKRKAGGDTGKWIGKARASMERRGTVGSLRKAMGAKEGQKIPTSSLQAKKAQAERTGNTKMMRKVNFALNVRK
jgi:hypothetical protein